MIANPERGSITVLLTSGAISGRALRYCSMDGVVARACVIDIWAAGCVEGLKVAILL